MARPVPPRRTYCVPPVTAICLEPNALGHAPIAIVMPFSPCRRFEQSSLRLQAHQPGNEIALNLRGAGGDRRDPCIAIVALHVEFAVIAIAAENLHALIRDLGVGL